MIIMSLSFVPQLKSGMFIFIDCVKGACWTELNRMLACYLPTFRQRALFVEISFEILMENHTMNSEQ